MLILISLLRSYEMQLLKSIFGWFRHNKSIVLFTHSLKNCNIKPDFMQENGFFFFYIHEPWIFRARFESDVWAKTMPRISVLMLGKYNFNSMQMAIVAMDTDDYEYQNYTHFVEFCWFLRKKKTNTERKRDSEWQRFIIILLHILQNFSLKFLSMFLHHSVSLQQWKEKREKIHLALVHILKIYLRIFNSILI